MAGQTTISVRLPSGEMKRVTVDEFMSVAETEAVIAADLGLEGKGAEMFKLFHLQGGYERLPDPNERVVEIQSNFAAEYKKMKKKKKKLYKMLTESSFAFRKWCFSRSKEKDATDATGGAPAQAALRQLYFQARYDVINSVIPCHGVDAVALAGLQMQVEYGDYNERQRRPGWLKQHSRLVDFVPTRSHNLKLHTALEWEEAIFTKHAEHVGLSEWQAMREYLDYARQSVFYGAIVFRHIRLNQNGRNIGVMMMPLAVSGDALVFHDKDSHATLWQIAIKQILNYGAAREAAELVFIHIKDNSGVKHQPYMIRTVQRHFLSQTLTKAMEDRHDDLKLKALQALRSASPKNETEIAASVFGKWREKTLEDRGGRRGEALRFPDGSSDESSGGQGTSGAGVGGSVRRAADGATADGGGEDEWGAPVNVSDTRMTTVRVRKRVRRKKDKKKDKKGKSRAAADGDDGGDGGESDGEAGSGLESAGEGTRRRVKRKAKRRKDVSIDDGAQ